MPTKRTLLKYAGIGSFIIGLLALIFSVYQLHQSTRLLALELAAGK